MACCLRIEPLRVRVSNPRGQSSSSSSKFIPFSIILMMKHCDFFDNRYSSLVYQMVSTSSSVSSFVHGDNACTNWSFGMKDTDFVVLFCALAKASMVLLGEASIAILSLFRLPVPPTFILDFNERDASKYTGSVIGFTLGGRFEDGVEGETFQDISRIDSA